VQAGNWAEVERALASNYVGVTPAERSTALQPSSSTHLAVERLCHRRFEDRVERNHIRGDYSITLNGASNGTAARNRSRLRRSI